MTGASLDGTLLNGTGRTGRRESHRQRWGTSKVDGQLSRINQVSRDLGGRPIRFQSRFRPEGNMIQVTITGGNVAYERSVKVAEYENKKAKVELSFGVPDGTDEAAQVKTIDYVLALAKTKCEGILGIRGAAPGERTKADLTGEAEAAAGKTTKPVTRKPPAPKPEETAPAEAKTTSAADITDDEPAAAESDSLDELTGTPAPKEITDAELIDKVKKANEVIANPLAIRQLGAKIGELKALRSVIEVPQDKRPAFLAALDKMAVEA
ncbi:MAG: hypothetical protein ACHQAQ_20790, partial [Hyphomicrobiales bacterium]